MIRVLVCGGRNYSNQERLERVLNKVLRDNGKFQVVHGGASGADAMADAWAMLNDCHTDVFPAHWETQGKAAGPKRNERMARTKPKLCVAFPGGAGTEDMIRRCHNYRIPVIRIED